MILRKGETLQDGKFVIDKELGGGGFGITYKAWQPNLKRWVVLKTQREGLRHATNWKKYQSQFLHEGQTMAKLSQTPHPNLVRVLDLFEESSIYYLVMNFVEGRTLAQEVKVRGSLPESETIAIAQQIGSALSFMHSHGCVHRDAHPDNIILCPNGQAILIDLGGVKNFTPSTQSVSATVANRSFAPYEQLTRRGTRHPTADIYCFAATLYYAVTGRKPTPAFERKLDNAALVPPTAIQPISESLNCALLDAMALEAENRPQTIDHWLEKLRDANEKENSRVTMQEAIQSTLETPDIRQPLRPILIRESFDTSEPVNQDSTGDNNLELSGLRNTPPTNEEPSINELNFSRSTNTQKIAETIASQLETSNIPTGIVRQVTVRLIPPPGLQSCLSPKTNGQKRLLVTCLCNELGKPDFGHLVDNTITPILVRSIRDFAAPDLDYGYGVIKTASDNTLHAQARVNLRSSEDLLKSWARWGDVEALSRLFNTALADICQSVTVFLRETSLYIFCFSVAGHPLAQDQVVDVLVPTAREVSPQGVQSLVIHGYGGEVAEQHLTVQNFDFCLRQLEKELLWVESCILSALFDVERRKSTASLAAQGYLHALGYLIDRVVNPRLEHRLITGGRQVVCHRTYKHRETLKVLIYGPDVPHPDELAPNILQRLEQLKIAGLNQVILYCQSIHRSHLEAVYQLGIDQDAASHQDEQSSETGFHRQSLLTKWRQVFQGLW